MEAEQGRTSPPRLLLVEDDERLARTLALSLEDSGSHVTVARSGADARTHLHRQEVDVVLLDLGLPDEDGLRLCLDIRRTSDVPIIMVTARTGSAEIVSGLEAGADDYVTKPVVGSELAARVRALLRRHRAHDGPRMVRVGDLEVDLEHGSVRRDGVEVALTRTERLLVRELACSAGRAVTREELLERVWGYEDIGDTRLLDVHVRRLRTKLERDPAAPELVLTVRGLGYRLGS